MSENEYFDLPEHGQKWYKSRVLHCPSFLSKICLASYKYKLQIVDCRSSIILFAIFLHKLSQEGFITR